MSARKIAKKTVKKAVRKTARTPAKRTTRQAAGRSSRPEPAKAAARSPAQGARAGVPILRPLPVYEFVAGELMGYVRLADPDRGCEFVRNTRGTSLPATCKEVLSLRHYLARGQGGILTPREEAECEGKVEKSAFIFRYRPTAKWPVTASVRYELLTAGGVDAAFSFSFAKELDGFEAGVETLVPRTYADVFVHARGHWIPAATGPSLKRFYPRNATAAEMIADGRWSGLRRAGIGLVVETPGYDYPMLVLWDADRHHAIVWMGLTDECSSIWVNGPERALGMGLVGANVKGRSASTCRLRALVCRAARLDDVLPHYREFVREARATRPR